MTPRERAFWLRVHRRSLRFEPDLARELVRAYARLRGDVSEAEIERLIRSAGIEGLLTERFDEATLERAFADFRSTMWETVEGAADYFAKDLPTIAQPAVSFDILNPRVLDQLRTLDTKVVAVLKGNVRETVRQHVLAGLEAGEGPRAIARELRSILSLAPNQAAAVRNFRAMLEDADPTALTRALRDRRFDATLRRMGDEGLSAEQIERMSAAYRRRMEAFNAETIARTVSADAMKLGQRMSWQDAIDKGLVDRHRLQRRWATVMDGRERPEHHEMNGEVVPFDQPYSNGDTYAGEGDPWNCRCIDVVSLARAA